MSSNLTSAILAATLALGSAGMASAMQGPRTGNPPGPERPMGAAQAPSSQVGPAMMGQMAQGSNPQMQAQMTQGCPCCQKMAKAGKDQRQR